MHSSEALNTLALRKAALQAKIALRREQLRVAVAEVARPLSLLDRGVGWWRSVPPSAKAAAAVPVGLMVARTVAKRFGGAAALLQYAPAVAQVARSWLSRRQP